MREGIHSPVALLSKHMLGLPICLQIPVDSFMTRSRTNALLLCIR